MCWETFGAPALFFAELRKLGDAEARHIVSRGLLCEEPSAGLLADVEYRLAAPGIGAVAAAGVATPYPCA